MTLHLYNTLTRRKEEFTPLDPKNVRLYVCGPTVYDRPHLGNARSVVVYDVLYRLLKHLYETQGSKVTYVRNITDIDDKINATAKQNGEPISALANRVTNWFHEDMASLGVLPATLPAPVQNPEEAIGCMIEPRATDHIPQMIELINKLIHNGNAYVADGHVLFDVTSKLSASSCQLLANKEADSRKLTAESWTYGMLSGRKLDDLIPGARVEVESYKRHPGDFVLWKPAEAGDDPSSVFNSPWGPGRPGWHIECSAMSSHYLGETFDIHGGGADLKFPHHENEIAQSCCAFPGSHFAKTWVHNGFLTVGGEKMAKSAGNFTTVRDLLDKGVKGEAIRFALLSAKYNEPLDWNEKLLYDAESALKKWYRKILSAQQPDAPLSAEFLGALGDDLNLPKAMSLMHAAGPDELRSMVQFLGLLPKDPKNWFKGEESTDEDLLAMMDALIAARAAAKKARNFAEADRIRDELKSQGILLEDRPDGTTDWRRE